MEGGNLKAVPLKVIRNSCVSLKVCLFAWEVWWRKVLTLEQLKKRGFQLANMYPLCRNAEEDLGHLLIHCPSVWGLWAALLSIPSLLWVCPYTVKNVLSDWSSFPIKKRARKLWLAAPLSLLWALWKERNRVVFEDEVFSPTRLKLSFVDALISRQG